MNTEISFEEYERSKNKIYDLELKVNEMSTKLKFIEENSQKIHDHTEKINDITIKLIVLKKDLEQMSTAYKNCNGDLCKKFASFDEMQELVKELRGEVNQIRMLIKEKELAYKEKKTRIWTHFVYPVLTAVVSTILTAVFMTMLFGKLSSNDSGKNTKPPYQQKYER